MYIINTLTAGTNYLPPIILCIILIAADQITKMITFNMLKPIGQITLIDGFFFLTYVENRGAAFGFLDGARWFFISITILIVCIAAVYYIRVSGQKGGKAIRAAIVMIISGALGNFIDRLFRGYVVDMLHFRFGSYDFAVFNFADMLVVCGTILLAAAILFFQTEEMK